VKPRETSNPHNRFHKQVVAYDEGDGPPPSQVTLLDDRSRSILSENDSPDLPFRYSANPYRGCQTACAYCYARPTHEYLDLGAGTDFDTKIVVKRDAPELLRAAFDKPSWRGDHVMFSGVTDCYQPIERERELTRRCLEVCLEYRNPASVISKHALVERDIDLFQELARQARFGISVSLAWTDADLARAIEPWAPSPERRLKTIETLAKAGVPVGVMASTTASSSACSSAPPTRAPPAPAGCSCACPAPSSRCSRSACAARCRSRRTRSCTGSARPAAATSSTTPASTRAAAARARTPT
jgi:hypothetical protein